MPDPDHAAEPALLRARRRRGKLVNRFLLVSNIETPDPSAIIAGNERVLRARLADAKFFFDQDRKHTLESRVAEARPRRLSQQARHAGRPVGARGARSPRRSRENWAPIAALASRAATLAKADLVTDMVGEFPELQGLMGRYYAEHDGERPRWPPRSNSTTGRDSPAMRCRKARSRRAWRWPTSSTRSSASGGSASFPTGDKDPFGLRRHALGVLRILLERDLPLDLRALIHLAADHFPARTVAAGYRSRRLRIHARSPAPVVARCAAHRRTKSRRCLADSPSRIDLVASRSSAVRDFAALPEAARARRANKRIVNILRKSGDEAAPAVDRSRPRRRRRDTTSSLAFQKLTPQVGNGLQERRFRRALRALAAAKPAVDRYFDDVHGDGGRPAIRANRLALLRGVAATMNRVADISSWHNKPWSSSHPMPWSRPARPS